jgi:hypothetical protein
MGSGNYLQDMWEARQDQERRIKEREQEEDEFEDYQD